MGLMDKFKNLFTEEIEEERPIKKEVRHVEIPSPKRSDITPATEVNNISDSSIISKEEKVITPVYFDDKDFDDLEKPKPKPKEIVKERVVPKREENKVLYGGSKPLEEKKIEPVTFKPSPIISPVYGVLDKNYFKDDVTPVRSKPKETILRKSSDKVTIDDIRNKAYGTLEDDLKNSFFEDYEEKKDNGAIDVLEELDFDEIEANDKVKIADNKVSSIILDDLDLDEDTELLAMQLEEQNRKLAEINQMMDDEKEISDDVRLEDDEKEKLTINEQNDDFEELEENKVIEPVEPKKEEKKEIKKEATKSRTQKKSKKAESLTDSELFDLVDSMYDEKGE